MHFFSEIMTLLTGFILPPPVSSPHCGYPCTQKPAVFPTGPLRLSHETGLTLSLRNGRRNPDTSHIGFRFYHRRHR